MYKKVLVHLIKSGIESQLFLSSFSSLYPLPYPPLMLFEVLFGASMIQMS